MNYNKQFAAMLGLELEQEFVLTDSNGKRKDSDTYKITENGLYYKSPTSSEWFTEPSETIERLLDGADIAVPKPWKPKNGEKYWFYSETYNNAMSHQWYSGDYEFCLWKCGNCFKTEEEAAAKGKEIMEQIQKEYEEA